MPAFNKVMVLQLLLLCTGACSSKHSLHSQRLAQGGSATEIPEQLRQNHKIQQVGNEKLVLLNQFIDSVEIEGGYLKTISNKKSDLIFAKWSYRDQLSHRLQKQKNRMFQGLDDFPRKLKTRHRIFEQYEFASKPQLYLNLHGDLLWKLEYSDQLGQSFAAFFDEDLDLVQTRRLSSHFDNPEAIGAVYPLGLLKSEIQSVPLKHLSGQQELASSPLKVRTKSNAPAVAEHGQFVFDSSDDRLKQVQVYYDIIESMEWFKQKFQFNLEQPLLVEMSMGFPDKTNAAFYYRSKINLGDGDGNTYKDMPLDPSITRHESVHAVIDQIAGLVNENESASLNEALADYFTAAQRNNSKMGEISYKKGDAKRNLSNSMKFSEKNGATYHDSLILSGMLWQIRSDVGAETTDQLVWETVKRLHPLSDFADFRLEFLSELKKLSSEHQSQIQSILFQREWPLSGQ